MRTFASGAEPVPRLPIVSRTVEMLGAELKVKLTEATAVLLIVSLANTLMVFAPSVAVNVWFPQLAMVVFAPLSSRTHESVKLSETVKVRVLLLVLYVVFVGAVIAMEGAIWSTVKVIDADPVLFVVSFAKTFTL